MKTRNFFVAVLAIVAALVVMPQNSDAQILKGLGEKIEETAKTAKTDAPAATTATTSSSNSSEATSTPAKTGGYKSNDGVVVSYGKTGREDITPRFVLEGEENGVSVPTPQPWYIETEHSDDYGDGVGGNLVKGKVKIGR